MKQIRSSVFETNSSSSHSISIYSGNSPVLSTITPCSGKIVLEGGRFGWEYDHFNDPLTKANYCALDCILSEDNENLQMLIDVVKEHTGALEVVINIDLNDSYIDHQSIGVSLGAFESKDLLKRFLFDRRSVLTTDNDNH